MTAEGHVYPAIFELVCGFALLHQTVRALRSHAPNDRLKLATNGGTFFLRRFGLLVLFVSTISLLVEGIGGLVSSSHNFFLQSAHLAVHVAYWIAGLACVLEGHKRLPFDSGRFVLGVAFFVEGVVFLAHLMHQEELEASMHFVLSVAAFGSGACLLAAVTFDPTNLVLHVSAASGLIFQGIWLVWVALVVFTPIFADVSISTMDIYMQAALLAVFVLFCVGSSFVRYGPLTENADTNFSFDYTAYAPLVPPTSTETKEADPEKVGLTEEEEAVL